MSTLAKEEEACRYQEEKARRRAARWGQTRISVLRQGATTVGPSSRPVTIFPGDYVVHRALGIARFIDCVVDERWPMISCLRLNFGNNAEFVVNPADRDKVSRLKSSDAAKPPKLTPLTEKGLAMWAARVKRVEESTKVIAQDILALYAARNEFVREPCAPDNDDFAAFEGMFEFEPTVDQAVLDDVAHDMIGRQRQWTSCAAMYRYAFTPPAQHLAHRRKSPCSAHLLPRAAPVALLAPTTVLAAAFPHHQTADAVCTSSSSGAAPPAAEGRRVRYVGNGTAAGGWAHAPEQDGPVRDCGRWWEEKGSGRQKERLKMATGVDVLTHSKTNSSDTKCPFRVFGTVDPPDRPTWAASGTHVLNLKMTW